MAMGCKKDNDTQLKIIITDIPAEYNGLMAQSTLSEPYDDPFYGYWCASGGIFEDGGITNGKATIYYTGSFSIPYTKKGEYNVSFQIFEGIGEGVPPPITVWHWGGECLVNITKTTTTISFNTLKKDKSVTYPFTVGVDDGYNPQEITITDIPAEHNDISFRYGYVYLLKPDDRELYAKSYGYEINNGKSTPRLERTNITEHIEKGKYIVVFKIKESKSQGETIYWEGESEPMDITKKNTIVSINTLKKWDRTYPYTTDIEEVWTDRK